MTCQYCDYIPAKDVDNPKKLFRDHQRRQHPMHCRPYTIVLEPSNE